MINPGDEIRAMSPGDSLTRLQKQKSSGTLQHESSDSNMLREGRGWQEDIHSLQLFPSTAQGVTEKLTDNLDVLDLGAEVRGFALSCSMGE